MAKGDKSGDVLLVDDEPEHIEWVSEFLITRGYQCEFARTLPEALEKIAFQEYRLFVVDMNIPAHEAITPELRKRTPLVDRYPGIVVAITARNAGYGAHSVIAYTVHDDDAADRELQKLHCRYVLKGRPSALKQVIVKSLIPPPH